MKRFFLICLAGLWLVGVAITACATSKYKVEGDIARLEVYFASPIWDALKVPLGQQCGKLGGRGGTPSLLVRRIPAKANVLIMEFSDLNSPEMNNGGHGQIGYKIKPGTPTITIPSVPGNTFNLPECFFMVAAHRRQSPVFNQIGAYLPPCTEGHGYYLTIKAVYDAPSEKEKSLLLAEATVALGTLIPPNGGWPMPPQPLPDPPPAVQ